MHQNPPKMFPSLTLKETPYFKLKSGGMLFNAHFVNIYQQKPSDFQHAKTQNNSSTDKKHNNLSINITKFKCQT